MQLFGNLYGVLIDFALFKCILKLIVKGLFTRKLELGIKTWVYLLELNYLAKPKGEKKQA